MTFNENQFPKFVNLPPRVPNDPEDINRAVCLLGNRIASDLKEKSKNELIFLLGVYPNPEQAKLWKHALKKMLKNDMTLDPEPALPPVRPPAAKQSTRKSGSKRSKRQSSRSQSSRSQSSRSQSSKSQSTKNRSPQPVSDRFLESDYYMGVSNLASIDLNMFRDDDEGFDD
ncbi:hypothetical protein [Egbenema bharatensis]|uniref:hypothetical protein n=1 Tax=Egbenema bharatensis TaxID=3463334 RepID=UPI003A8A43AD